MVILNDEYCAYLDEGIRLLELAQKAGSLFRNQSPAEKRQLLGFVLLNCTWKDRQLAAEYRQPFDLLAKNVIALETKNRLSMLKPVFLIFGSPGQARTADLVINSLYVPCITEFQHISLASYIILYQEYIFDSCFILPHHVLPQPI